MVSCVVTGREDTDIDKTWPIADLLGQLQSDGFKDPGGALLLCDVGAGKS